MRASEQGGGLDAAAREVLLMADVSLRILVVLPMYGGSLPIGRYCVDALRDLGHSVQVFDAPRLYPAFTGLKELGLPPMSTGPLENSLLQVVGQAIWTQVECWRPDFVLAMAQAPLNRLLLQRLKRAGIRTAMWFVEDYAVFDYWRAYAPLYDVFAVIQKEPFVSLLREAGQPRAPYLPLAALPSFHRMQPKRPFSARAIPTGGRHSGRWPTGISKSGDRTGTAKRFLPAIFSAAGRASRRRRASRFMPPRR